MTTPNADTIVSGRQQVVNTAIARWAGRLPDIVIPDEMELALKGAPGNAGLIYVARSSPDAQSIETSWPLLPNETITYKVKNATGIWFSGTVAGDYIHYTVEQKRIG